jgi:hypothetical protein
MRGRGVRQGGGRGERGARVVRVHLRGLLPTYSRHWIRFRTVMHCMNSMHVRLKLNVTSSPPAGELPWCTASSLSTPFCPASQSSRL